MKYGDFLPLTSSTPLITMGEGETPLVKSTHLGKELGCKGLYFKLEGCNPTGSFKDRGMVVAVAKALEAGTKGIMCASTGNTSASAAAYGARFGLYTIILIPKGAVAGGKLAQAMACGAKLLLLDCNFDAGLALAREITEGSAVTLVNSVNPHRLEGQKTAAFEIVDDLGDAPEYLFIPVGNAGNITAYWRGFAQYLEAGISKRAPHMMGFQAQGAAPIVGGQPVANPSTVATAIRIGNPASWDGAVAARDQSGGVIDSVTDEEILEAYGLMASREGIFCEPASAASVAGLRKLCRDGLDISDSQVVCVITGTGLKDGETAARHFQSKPIEVSADIKAIEAAVLALAA